jgi:excisionase family DNA binding protein
MPAPNNLLTTKQVAERLALSEPTVRRLARRGFLPRVRIGGSVRFRESDIGRIIKAGTR